MVNTTTPFSTQIEERHAKNQEQCLESRFHWKIDMQCCTELQRPYPSNADPNAKIRHFDANLMTGKEIRETSSLRCIMVLS